MELLPYFSPEERHISVETSTVEARVGEYVVLHVRATFKLDRFGYVVSGTTESAALWWGVECAEGLASLNAWFNI